MVTRGKIVRRAASFFLLCVALGFSTGCDSFSDWYRVDVRNTCDASLRVVASGADAPATWSTEEWLLLVPGEQGVAGVVPDVADPVVHLWAVLDEAGDAGPITWSEDVLEEGVNADGDEGLTVHLETPPAVCQELARLH